MSLLETRAASSSIKRPFTNAFHDDNMGAPQKKFSTLPLGLSDSMIGAPKNEEVYVKRISNSPRGCAVSDGRRKIGLSTLCEAVPPFGCGMACSLCQFRLCCVLYTRLFQ